MKLQIKLRLYFVLRVIGCGAFFLQAEITPDTMLNKTLDAWTTVDTVRSIAREDRHHLYPKLIKTNLDLYATTYWFTEQQPKNSLSEQYVEELGDIFTALLVAQKDTLTGQSISDDGQAALLPWNPSVEVSLKQKNIGGLFSCMIMDHTSALWKQFTTTTKSS